MHDLHTHSNLSDGILSPAQLVSRAAAQGVTTLALTDHDTTAGYAEARAEAARVGIALLGGIEFSCLWEGVNIHVVGLNIDPACTLLQDAITRQSHSRVSRAGLIAERLARLGIAGALAGAQRFAGEAQVARPHFARYLIEIGAVKDMNTAFKRYLGAGKPGDVKQLWPDVAEAVGWIRAAGGVAVLAHPDKYKMTRSKLLRLLREFSAGGGQALEVISGRQDPQLTGNLARLAADLNLAASQGSDFHVPDQPWQDVGRMGELPAGCRPVWELWQ